MTLQPLAYVKQQNTFANNNKKGQDRIIWMESYSQGYITPSLHPPISLITPPTPHFSPGMISSGDFGRRGRLKRVKAERIAPNTKTLHPSAALQ